MIESLLSNLGEIFLDLLITRSFNPRISKKKQILSIAILLFIFVVYVSIFVLSFIITLSSFHNDKELFIKMGIVTIILLLAFFVYFSKTFHHWKKHKKFIISLRVTCNYISFFINN